jgi:uncharacterized metal-binding protein YceD (DUF177 family)
MAEFVLHVPDIDEAGRDYAFELSPGWLDSHLRDATLRHDPAFGPGALEVHVQDNGGGEYLVTGALRAHLLTECGRCLGDATLAVDTQIATLFARTSARNATHQAPHAHQERRERPERQGRPERQERHQRGGRRDEHEVSDLEALEDDLPREEFSGNDIALDDLVREHIVLEVPMQPLCSEQCQGIPIPQHLRPPADVFPTEGAVDPRLAPLQRLRDNVPPKSPAQAPVPGGRPEKSSSPAASTLKKPSTRHQKNKPKSNKE